jgi:hypothetical protein
MRISLGRVLQTINIITMLIVFYSLFSECNECYSLFGSESKIAILLYLIIFIFLSRKSIVQDRLFYKVVIFSIVIAINQRYAFLAIDGSNMMHYSLYNGSNVFSSIVGLSVYTLFFMGISYFFPRRLEYEIKNIFTMKNILIKRYAIIAVLLFIAAAIIKLFQLYGFGLSGIGFNAESQNIFLRYFLRFMQIEVLYTIAFFLFMQVRSDLKSNALLHILMFFMIIFSVLSGSKAGLLFIILNSVFYIYLSGRDIVFKINIRTFMKAVALTMVAILLFSVNDVIRSVVWHNNINVKDYNAVNIVNQISERISIVDDSIRVDNLDNNEVGYRDIRDKVNIINTTYSSIDALIPTTLFPDIVRPQHALSYAYGNDPFEVNGILTNSGYVWGFYGFNKYVFNFFGGIVALILQYLFWISFLHIVFIIIKNIIIRGAIILFFVQQNTYFFITMFSMDEWLSPYLDRTISIILSVLLLLTLSIIFRGQRAYDS